jgi:hypothetical protein
MFWHWNPLEILLLKHDPWTTFQRW